MKEFKKIDITSMEFSPSMFEKVSKQWMLVSAGDENKSNAMTASWGGFGHLWNKNVAFVFVRPQRYTDEFIQNEERFALVFLKKEYKSAHSVYGSKSGRDCDKEKETGLTPAFVGGVPAYEEAEYVIVLRKLYMDNLKEDGFIDKQMLSNYPDKDFHHVYVAEIEAVYQA